jgi:hypothetical protein
MSEDISPGPLDFEAFRRRVVADPRLIALLWPIRDRAAFLTAVMELGTAEGYRFEDADVAAALSEGQFAWLTHWLPVV